MIGVFKGTDKVNSCLEPILRLRVTDIDRQRKIMLVETVASGTKLVLVHQKHSWTLRKFDIRGNIAGEVYNNWIVEGELDHEY